jgi:hypothetical protein
MSSLSGSARAGLLDTERDREGQHSDGRALQRGPLQQSRCCVRS